jgi:adenylate cyclase
MPANAATRLGDPGAGSYAATARDLADWLMREGRFLSNNGEILGELCERLAAAGLPLDRVSLHLRALHPQYRGVARIWKPGLPIDERFLYHGL